MERATMPEPTNTPTGTPPEPTPTAIPQQPIRVPDPSKPGGVQEFKTSEDLQRALTEAVKFKADLNAEIADLKKQQEEFRQGISRAISGQSGPANEQFDRAEYFRKLDDNPLEAQAYLRRFDPEWKALEESRQKERLERVAGVFLSNHPDFQPTEEAITGVLQTAAKLGYDERNVTPQQLSAAYAWMLYQKQRANPAQPMAQPGQQPPPHLPSGITMPTSAADDLATKIANAPTARDAERIARDAGLLP